MNNIYILVQPLCNLVINIPQEQVEEIVVPKDLKEFLTDVVEKRNGYDLGEPWKYSEESLLVVVPITRMNAPNRKYTTMYEVLKDLGIKDTGSINRVEMQNKAGQAVFVRAGTIFEGKTQNRAAQHSAVYKEGTKSEILVRCVHQTHGISPGSEMKYGSIAPMSVVSNLMMGNQSDVWNSVRNYTTGGIHRESSEGRVGRDGEQTGWLGWTGFSGAPKATIRNNSAKYRGRTYDTADFAGGAAFMGFLSETSPECVIPNTTGSDDLLGYIKSQGKEALDEMMQKVPLFENQAGAVIFNPLGVMALETFDSPKSWEAIKKEVIEKYGDHVSDTQAEHLFELNKDKIVPMLKKFIAGLDKFEEKTIHQDDLSETRAVKGDKVVGEYTLIKGRTIHCLLIKE
jgi:hypothetical protein